MAGNTATSRVFGNLRRVHRQLVVGRRSYSAVTSTSWSCCRCGRRVCAGNCAAVHLKRTWERPGIAPGGTAFRYAPCDNTCTRHTTSRGVHTTGTVSRGRFQHEYGPETSGVGWHSAAGLFSAVSQHGASAAEGPESGRLITSHKAEVNGVQIHYDQVGTGKNILLLLPGALGSSKTDFKAQLDGINKDMFSLIALDPRGYGQSRPPDRDWPAHFFERDAEDAAKLMQGVMRKFKNIGSKQYSLLGWSDGGITAMILAAMYPNMVKKLVVWGANAFVTPEELETYEKIRDINKWSAKMKEPMIKLYGEEYFQSQWNQWIDAVKRYHTEREGNFCKDSLKDIECPTLILHGEMDALVPRFHPEFLHENIADSRVHYFPIGRHNLHLKLYSQFNSIVENFLLEC